MQLINFFKNFFREKKTFKLGEATVFTASQVVEASTEVDKIFTETRKKINSEVSAIHNAIS